MNKGKKLLKWMLISLLILVVLLGVTGLIINAVVVSSADDNLLYSVTDQEALDQETIEMLKAQEADCILVLGAAILNQSTPSPMLKDRLDAGILLYEAGVAPKLLLSGDNGQVEYNEIHVMLNYVKDAGVPEEDIFCDHAGFSTYDSMYRANDIFQAESLIVVTQEYHQYRALYIGEKLGLKVAGVSSDQGSYSGQLMREIREILARDKDFFKVNSKATAILSGEVIPINGSGLTSHGE